ncbi:MAG: chemotaxis protein CheW [Spirochaetaceae bacterium]|nr:chemotaxis protein CheW [Spirochaetaceae bacterium]
MSEQFLTFRVGEAQYAVSVFRVREVLEFREPQTLPCPDPLIAGIIRSRDANIAVVRLREKFGLESKKCDANTRIIVFEANLCGRTVLFGAIVDSVQEVIELEMAEEPPPMGNTIASRFVSGVGIRGGNYIIVLNSDLIFSIDELENINDANEAAQKQRQGEI